jgi:hypothetical protein
MNNKTIKKNCGSLEKVLILLEGEGEAYLPPIFK